MGHIQDARALRCDVTTRAAQIDRPAFVFELTRCFIEVCFVAEALGRDETLRAFPKPQMPTIRIVAYVI